MVSQLEIADAANLSAPVLGALGGVTLATLTQRT